jgi:transcriptional regulator with GAF, ATPase, and Fis domain
VKSLIVAEAGLNTVVCGETGVGKELVVPTALPEIRPPG